MVSRQPPPLSRLKTVGECVGAPSASAIPAARSVGQRPICLVRQGKWKATTTNANGWIWILLNHSASFRTQCELSVGTCVPTVTLRTTGVGLPNQILGCRYPVYSVLVVNDGKISCVDYLAVGRRGNRVRARKGCCYQCLEGCFNAGEQIRSLSQIIVTKTWVS